VQRCVMKRLEMVIPFPPSSTNPSYSLPDKLCLRSLCYTHKRWRFRKLERRVPLEEQ